MFWFGAFSYSHILYSLYRHRDSDIGLLQACLVGGLPDLGECHGAVEPMEDAQGQCDALDDRPGHEAVKLQLNLWV